MMKNRILYLFLLNVYNPVASFSQTSEKEEVEEMAMIYFVRLSKYTTYAMYYILDNDSLININQGIN